MRNRIRDQIEEELEKLSLPEGFCEKIISQADKKHFSFSIKAAVLILCMVVSGTAVAAAGILKGRISVNEQQLPQLNPMEWKQVNEIRENEDGEFRKTFSSCQELEEEIGIELPGIYLTDSENSRILCTGNNNSWMEINIAPFVVGDSKVISEEEQTERYTYEPGSVYGSPVDLKIQIITGEDQLEAGWDIEYLGAFSYADTWKISQVTVNVLKEESDGITEEDYRNGYKDNLRAVFVTNGMRYFLEGHISDKEMKNLVEQILSASEAGSE